ncbi:MAG TPA: TonB-dependent receptor [Steroidobacteraceae bacterium]|jgi:iron complex outermembrane receptor protein|nr:TonB-dependent receptor [Steroidobacteraceae bacterium]
MCAIRGFFSTHISIVAGAGALAFFSGAPAGAQQAPASTAPGGGQELQEIVVTGSLIKRTDTETPSPIQIITADDIKNSGYTNVSDVLRQISANGSGTLSQGFGQAFAAGASGIALRGLSVGDTLTLIDGERMVAYPLSDDGERSFVDVTSIPINAVEGVDVLKDNASATYGADAIAGVVNIRLKKSYVGSEFTVEAGSTQHGDGTTEHANGIWGVGDLSSDGYNFYVAIDWHHQDQILGANRSGAFTTTNWSALPGGLNTQPGAVGASALTYPDSVTGYLVNPTSGAVSQFLPGCTAALQAADKCTFAFPGQIQPPTTQINVLSKFTKALANDWSFTVTGSVFDSSAEQVAATTFGHAFNNTGQENGSIVNITFAPGRLAGTVVYPVLSLPPTSPLNHVGGTTPQNLVYSFPDVGPYQVDVDTITYRLFGDLKGTAAGWDIDGQVGVMYASMSQKMFGSLIPSLAQSNLNSGTYAPGVSTNGQFLFAPENSDHPSSTLGVIDAHASHELFQMPGGPATFLLGGQYIHKALNAQDPPSVVSGYQEGTTAFAVGSQDDAAGFVELQGKPVKQLEIDISGRYDHYDTYGGSATPKIGIKFTPIDQLAFRGTWGQGFRAPSIAEAGTAGLAFGQGNTNDPVLCPGGVANIKGTFNALCAYPALGVQSSNPGLKAVKSTNATFGVIFQPIQAVSASVDWYYIKLTNDIISASSAGSFYTDAIALVRGPATTAAVCTATTAPAPCPTATVTTPVGYPAYTLIPYVNAGETKTSGFDLDLKSQFDIGDFGRLKAELNYTYIAQYELVASGQLFDLAGTHGPSTISGDTGNPRQRAVASLTWNLGNFTSTLSVNYQSAFSITDPTIGANTCLGALKSRAPSAYGSAISAGTATLPSTWYPYCEVGHFTSTNLYAAYQATDHLQVHGSITNLFDQPPPVDLQTYGGGAELAYSTLDQDGAVGRFFLLGATYKF